MTRVFLRNLWLSVLLGLVAVPAAFAADLEEAIPRSKPSDKLVKLSTGMEDSLRKVYTQLTIAEDWDNTFFVHPTRLSSVVSFKEVTERYSYKTRTIPVYKYETYKEVIRTTDGEVKEVTRKRRVKQIGTKEQKYLVRDPNGPIEKTRRIPIRDPKGGGLQVRNGIIAQNSMGLYAALKSGVPQDDVKIQEYLESLQDVIKYGLPDHTWDLAWLTAAYANLPQRNQEQEEAFQQMVNKLILGADMEKGPGQGLWGPICINSKVLAAVLEYQQKLMKKYSKEKKKAKKKGKKDDAQEDLQEVAALQEDFKKLSTLFDCSGLYMGQKRRYYLVVGKTEADPGLKVPNFPCYVFREFLYDMDSTAIAVFALHEVWKKKLLPEKTVMPTEDGKREIIKSEKVSSILDTVMKAVLKKQAKDGTWSECNTWAPVHQYDDLEMALLDVKDDDFAEFKSPTTVLSTCEGYTVVRNLADILGKSKSVGRPLGQAEARVKKDFDAAKADKFTLPQVEEHPERVFEYLFFLSQIKGLKGDVLDVLAGKLAKVPAVEKRGPKSGELYISALIQQHIDATMKRDFDWMMKLRGKKAEMNDKWKKKDLGQRKAWYSEIRFPNYMSHALGLIVANEVTQGDSPVVAYWPDLKNSYTRKFAGALSKKISTTSKTRPRFQGIGATSLYKDDSYLGVPIMIASDSMPPKYVDKTAEKFAQYIKAGGLVLLMGPAGKNDDVVAKLEEGLGKLVEGLEKKPLKTESGASVPCLVKDGVPQVLIMKVGKEDSATEIKSGSVMKLAMAVMQKKLGPAYQPVGSPEIDATQICQDIYEKVEKERQEEAAKKLQELKDAADKKVAEEAAEVKDEGGEKPAKEEKKAEAEKKPAEGDGDKAGEKAGDAEAAAEKKEAADEEKPEAKDAGVAKENEEPAAEGDEK